MISSPLDFIHRPACFIYTHLLSLLFYVKFLTRIKIEREREKKQLYNFSLVPGIIKRVVCDLNVDRGKSGPGLISTHSRPLDV
jgi:hypothetical protein